MRAATPPKTFSVTGRAPDRRIAIALALTVVLGCLVSPSATDARVIAVAGWNTEGAPCDPRGIPARCIGLFETARVLAGPEGVVSTHRLPGVSSQGLIDADHYASTEFAVWTSATAILLNRESAEPVVLLGHSHGAILVLRVAHQLAQAGVQLQRLRVVTIDPIVILYPFPVFLSVPCGVSRALNFYQTSDPPLTGARVRNATNVDGSSAIHSEQALGNLQDPDDERFMPALLAPNHTFIDDSFTVRRRILARFDRDTEYLPGFWHWTMTGRVVSGPIIEHAGLTLLDYTDGASRGFLARELYIAGRFKRFLGEVVFSSLSGIWTIPSIVFPGQAAFGSFMGTTDFRHRIDISVDGHEPVLDPGFEFPHFEPFTGTGMFERLEFEAPEEFIPDACPQTEILLILNGASFRPGETLVVGQHLRNPGAELVVDVYLGVVLPDGTVLFVTGLAPLTVAIGRADDARSFRPLQTNAVVPSNSEVTTPSVLSVTFTGDEPTGTYTIFAALSQPRAFEDGRIAPDDILAFSVQSFAVAR